MNILEKIIRDKEQQLAVIKKAVPLSNLKTLPLFKRARHSLAASLRSSTVGIIAEHKRRSPSKAVINQSLDVSEVARGYEMAGVSGMSVLTDTKYFGGALEDLTLARSTCELPLLRKEFIIDPYQLYEAKAYGADAVLLIAAVLSSKKLKQLSETAKDLGLEVLLEVHNEKELHKSSAAEVAMIGVNNRNLKTFEVSLETSKKLASAIPDHVVKVSESGISSPEAIKTLAEFGYKGFLIGENFMKTADPGESAKDFIKALQQ